MSENETCGKIATQSKKKRQAIKKKKKKEKKKENKNNTTLANKQKRLESLDIEEMLQQARNPATSGLPTPMELEVLSKDIKKSKHKSKMDEEKYEIIDNNHYNIINNNNNNILNNINNGEGSSMMCPATARYTNNHDSCSNLNTNNQTLVSSDNWSHFMDVITNNNNNNNNSNNNQNNNGNYNNNNNNIHSNNKQQLHNIMSDHCHYVNNATVINHNTNIGTMATQPPHSHCLPQNLSSVYTNNNHSHGLFVCI